MTASLKIVGTRSKTTKNAQKKAEEVKAERKAAAEKHIQELTVQALEAWQGWETLSRKSAKSFWETGKLLAKVKTKIKESSTLTGLTWKGWCEQHNIAFTSADQAIRVGELTEKQIERCETITLAKMACGVIKVKVQTHDRNAPTESAPTPPEHEKESVVRLLTKINTQIGEALKFEVSEEERQTVNDLVAEATTLLQKFGAQKIEKVAA